MQRQDSPATTQKRSSQRNRSKGVTGIPLAFVLIVTGFSLSLTACSPPVRAPVVSREKVTVKPAPRRAYYRVKKGDTLYSISWRFDLAPQTLARMNGIRSPYTIYPGQSLGLSPLKSGLTQRLPAKPMSKSRSPIQSKANTVRKREKADPPSKREEKPVKAVKKQVVEKKYQQLLKLSWGWPTRGTLVQRFVKGDPLRKGVKLRGSVGQPVKAAEAGKVVYAGSGLVGYGRLIIIKHSKSYLSAYGLNRRILVKEGDQVSKGMAIAEMGEGGKGIAQLHFEIRHNGAPVNPLVLLPRRH